MMKITETCPASEMLDTCYGKIPYLDWLLLESFRINQNPKRQTEVVERDGGVCLVENTYNNYAELVKDMGVKNENS